MAELTLLDAASRQATGAFLARLLRLDPAAVVRLRPARPAAGPAAAGPVAGGPAEGGLVELWGWLPFGVLATRSVLATCAADATVRAGDLLAAVAASDQAPDAGGPWPVPLPRRHDMAWRWSLPPAASEQVESLAAADVRRVSDAAAATVAAAGAGGLAGRAVGDRALRDALLDHVPFVVTPDPPGADRVAVPQRLVQGLMRMGFVPREEAATVGVRAAGRWVGLAARYGACWYQRGHR